MEPTKESDQLSRLASYMVFVDQLKVLIRTHYTTTYNGKTHITVGGLQAIGSMLGYTTKTESCEYREVNGQAGYWTSVSEVISESGHSIGRGVGHVHNNEHFWKDQPAFAMASMSQTRAMGRALKGCVGWMLAPIGVEFSFDEEMPKQTPTTSQEPMKVSNSPIQPVQPVQQPVQHAYRPSPPQQQPAYRPPQAQGGGQKFDNMPDNGMEIFTPTSADIIKEGFGRGGPWSLVVVRTVEGPQFSTLRKDIANYARELCGSNMRCTITWKRSPKGGLEIANIAQAPNETPSASPPFQDLRKISTDRDDLPF